MKVFDKKHNIVVMDGSDRFVMNNIVRVVGMCAYPHGGNFDYHKLDEAHPNMMIVKFKANTKQFNRIMVILDTIYPALCNYDVAV